MSLESVRAWFAEHAPDIEVLVTDTSSATVAEAASTHNVEPAQIAKTICVRAGDKVLLIVTSGASRLDNKKFKAAFGVRPRMLGADEVLLLTGHPVGGVCPFGLATDLPVYCDVSLQRFEIVVPAAGAGNAAVLITTARMADLTKSSWVDVC
ncbi:MAG TPA: YbaK/EbsC family protein [Xanthobacteraceae bacterium]|nr:YbaK/EbsC family protein [Xanthobacteraceae bacterium]